MDENQAKDAAAPRRPFVGRARAPASPYATASAARSSSQLSPATVRFFDPNRFLAVIAVLFWPLKFFSILLVPALVLAGLTMFKHWNVVFADLHRLLEQFSFIVHLLLSLLIINLSVRLSMGAVVRAFGGAVHEFGLIFFLGFIPRFYIDRSAISRLDRSGQLWAYGAPLLVRLGFFAFGMLAWATYRSNGTWAADLALLTSQAGLWSFLFAIIPFLGDGYNWLAIYFSQPVLRQKALIALSSKLRGRQLPPGIQPGEAKLLIVLAVGFILAVVAFAIAVLIFLATLLLRLQGLGAVIFLALIGAFAIWLLNLRQQLTHRKRPRDAQLLQALMAGAAERQAAPAAPRRKRRLVMWAASAVALIILAFLPYSYDSAGPFEILPGNGSQVIARTAGEVVDVMVHEGDWVDAGQVLAHLSSTDKERAAALTREEVAQAEARLTRLKENGSSANRDAGEEARSEVDRLQHKLEQDEAELDRTAVRAPVAGFVTTPNPQFLTGRWFNDGDKLFQIDDTRVVEAEIKIPQADIAFVKLGAEVRLRPWSQTDGEIVGRVNEVSPIASTEAANDVITGDEPPGNAPRVLRPGATNSYDPSTSADYRTSEVINPNEPAVNDRRSRRRRAARAAAREEAAATAGSIVRVKALVDNAAGMLRPAMTGYAKISGPHMTVGAAYLQACIRLFTVELWSWVP